MFNFCRRLCLGAALIFAAAPGLLADESYELPPISYSATAPHDRVTAVQEQLASGKLQLTGDEKSVLRRLLKAFGIPESSHKALRIMQVTTIMVVMLLAWCVLTIMKVGYQPVPLPTMTNIHFSGNALGWLSGTIAPTFTAIAIRAGLTLVVRPVLPVRVLGRPAPEPLV